MSLILQFINENEPWLYTNGIICHDLSFVALALTTNAAVFSVAADAHNLFILSRNSTLNYALNVFDFFLQKFLYCCWTTVDVGQGMESFMGNKVMEL